MNYVNYLIASCLIVGFTMGSCLFAASSVSVNDLILNLYGPAIPGANLALSVTDNGPNQVKMTVTNNIANLNSVFFLFNSQPLDFGATTVDPSGNITSLSSKTTPGIDYFTSNTYDYRVIWDSPPGGWNLGQNIIINFFGNGITAQNFLIANPYYAEAVVFGRGLQQVFAAPVVASAPEVPTYLLLGGFLGIGLALNRRFRKKTVIV